MVKIQMYKWFSFVAHYDIYLVKYLINVQHEHNSITKISIIPITQNILSSPGRI